jgi:hypothetical protein
MKLVTLSVAAAAMVVFAHSAQAREHHRHHSASHREAWVHHRRHFREEEASGRYLVRYVRERHYGRALAERRRYDFGYADRERRPYRESVRNAYRGGLGPRPSAWCGWEMRQLVGADPGQAYNLARNWAHWGHAGPAGIGAVVVWAHHVGKIVGREGGQWVIESGNDGHQVRTRPRSIGGAIAVRWG